MFVLQLADAATPLSKRRNDSRRNRVNVPLSAWAHFCTYRKQKWRGTSQLSAMSERSKSFLAQFTKALVCSASARGLKRTLFADNVIAPQIISVVSARTPTGASSKRKAERMWLRKREEESIRVKNSSTRRPRIHSA